jgi:hypothetical protein
MVRIAAAMVLGLVLWAGGARAEGSALDQAIARNPERFQARALDLIAGFGGAGGLTSQGIEEHIALERAAARAAALRRIWAMDLDADGAVARDELAVAQRAASAAARGRMERQFVAADGNGDARIDAAEIASEGQAAALRALGEDEADLLRALLALDADGDDALAADELRAAVLRLGEAG